MWRRKVTSPKRQGNVTWRRQVPNGWWTGWLAACLTGCVLVVSGGAPAAGQADAEPRRDAPDRSNDPPADTRDPGGLKPQAHVVASPIGNYTMGQWGTVTVDARNPTDRDQEVVYTIKFAGHKDLQYSRRFLIPAMSRRHAVIPLKTPESNRISNRFEVLSQLITVDAAGREVALRGEGEQMERPLPLRVDRRRGKTALVFNDWEADPLSDRQWSDVQGARDLDYELIATGLVRVRQSRATAELHESHLPPLALNLASLDNIVLNSDRIVNDSAGILAIRQWVEEGGHLWIYLNNVSQRTAQMVVGDAAEYEELDRVSLSEFQMLSRTTGQVGERRTFDVPVEMVRVVTDADVLHEIDGWPVAFSRPLGQGTVWFTTLDATGWVRDKSSRGLREIRPISEQALTAPDPALAEFERRSLAEVAEMSTDFELTPEGDALVASILGEQEKPPWRADDVQPSLDEQIGYRIPSRGLIAAVLGGFCGCLLVAGLAFAAQGKLERLIWAIPVTSLAAVAVLWTIGSRHKHVTPPTVVISQLVQVVPETGEGHVDGLALMYQPDAGRTELGGDAGARLEPDLTGTEGSIKRMMWTDWDRWHWQNLELGSGVHKIQIERTMRFDQPVRAEGALGPDGFEGQLIGWPAGDFTDPLLATDAKRRSGAAFDGQTFRIGSDDVMDPGQFLSRQLVSDQQRRHKQMYEQILAPEPHRGFPSRPTLMGWAYMVKEGLTFPEQMRRTGSALLAIPIELQRTPPDTPVSVPNIFLRIDGNSRVYTRSGDWLEDAKPTRSELRFHLPPEVLPMQVAQAKVTIKVRAPSRNMRILDTANDRVLFEKRNPGGVFSVVVEDPESLVLQDGEHLAFTFELGKQADVIEGEAESATWKIDYVRCDLQGRTLPRVLEAAPSPGS